MLTKVVLKTYRTKVNDSTTTRSMVVDTTFAFSCICLGFATKRKGDQPLNSLFNKPPESIFCKVATLPQL